MTLIPIDGVWINPDAVVMVRRADPNALGFQTELVTQNGVQLLKPSPTDVVLCLTETV